jgi:hypothetical protein
MEALKVKKEINMEAFSKALALESVPENLSHCNSDDLVEFATTVAYKVFHNLKNGHIMVKDDDPIIVDGKLANEVWEDHYK